MDFNLVLIATQKNVPFARQNCSQTERNRNQEEHQLLNGTCDVVSGDDAFWVKLNQQEIGKNSHGRACNAFCSPNEIKKWIFCIGG